MAAAKAPPELSPQGQAAFRRAQRHVDDPDRFYDASVVYAHAVDRAWRIRKAWEEAGCPVTSTPRSKVPNPQIKAMAAADKAVLDASAVLGLDPAARKGVGSRGAGRPQGTDIPPALGVRPSDRLRAVK